MAVTPFLLPVMAVAAAAVLLGETLTASATAAGLVILFGVWLVHRPRRRVGITRGEG